MTVPATRTADDLDERRRGIFDVEVLGDGWTGWNLKDESLFNAFLQPLSVRREAYTADGRAVARVRMVPRRKHANLGINVHGGTTLAFMDVALFAAGHQFGMLDAGPAVTIDLASQFVGAGRIDEPMDAVVEMVRETGRMAFMRGLIVQGEGDRDIVASFTGTIRKPSRVT
jgi:acyl-coenzyme A thioesterase PaaI-like protein